MKYRIVKRAVGWVVQEFPKKVDPLGIGEEEIPKWTTLSTHRFHFVAALRLLWLRERARK